MLKLIVLWSSQIMSPECGVVAWMRSVSSGPRPVLLVPSWFHVLENYCWGGTFPQWSTDKRTLFISPRVPVLKSKSMSVVSVDCPPLHELLSQSLITSLLQWQFFSPVLCWEECCQLEEQKRMQAVSSLSKVLGWDSWTGMGFNWL